MDCVSFDDGISHRWLQETITIFHPENKDPGDFPLTTSLVQPTHQWGFEQARRKVQDYGRSWRRHGWQETTSRKWVQRKIWQEFFLGKNVVFGKNNWWELWQRYLSLHYSKPFTCSDSWHQESGAMHYMMLDAADIHPPISWVSWSRL